MWATMRMDRAFIVRRVLSCRVPICRGTARRSPTHRRFAPPGSRSAPPAYNRWGRKSGLEQMLQDLGPRVHAAHVGMGERCGIPRACEQIDGGAGLGDEVSVLVPVLDEGVVGDAERVLVVVEVELIVGQALVLEPVLGAL